MQLALAPRVLATAFALALASFACTAPCSAQVVRADAALLPGVSSPGAPGERAYAADHDRVCVGYPDATDVGFDDGAVIVFERADDLTWSRAAVLSSSAAATGVGSTVALDGARLVSGHVATASVTVFDQGSDGTWSESATLFSPTDAAGFGRFVDVDGDRIAVAAYAESLGSAGGELTVFARDVSGAWLVEDSLAVESIATPGYYYPSGVVLSGDRVLVGARELLAPPFIFAAGAIHVFARDANGAWTLDTTVDAPAVGDTFGVAFDFDGTNLVVGAPGVAGGRIQVFEENSVAGFVLVDQLTAPPSGAFVPKLGRALALGGGRLVAPWITYTSAVLYERGTNGAFEQIATLELPSSTNTPVAAMSEFGARIALPHYDEDLGISGVAVFGNESLLHGAPTISLVEGGAQALVMRGGPAAAGAVYLMLGSATGASPATPLGSGVTLPLVADAYTNMTLGLGAPIVNAVGVLDGSGAADASFALPPASSPALAGLTLFHAYLAVLPSTFQIAASNAVRLELVP